MTAMSRIAAALLIAAAALALDAGLLRGASAAEAGALRAARPLPPAQEVMAEPGRTARILSLVLCLEALRQAPELLAPPKRQAAASPKV
jgi:hypothetical protein